MALAEQTLEELFAKPVKFKKNRQRVGGGRSAKARAASIVKRSPEVMVKISGNTKGADHTQAHLDYISRNGKVELEDDQGRVITDKEGVRDLADEWDSWRGTQRKNTRNTTNIVLSMPAGTNPKKVKDAVRAFAKDQFGDNHQYVMALHTDTDSPHVHLTVNNFGFDTRRLHVKKGDPQRWREGFAHELRRLGVDAEATPRALRGVVKKGESQVLRHIRDKITPEVDQAKIREIVDDIKNQKAGKPAPDRPWESKIAERQTKVRKTWLKAAQELHQSDDQNDVELAKQMALFVKDMPPMKTERHENRERLAAKLPQRQRQGQRRQDRDQEAER